MTLDNNEKEEYDLISKELETLLNKAGFKDKDKQIAALVAKINDIENANSEAQKPDLKIVKNDKDE